MYSVNNTKINSTQLTQLLTRLGSLLKTHDLVTDSRKLTDNCIFCAYLGTKVDGRDFIEFAVQHGAGVVLYVPAPNFVIPTHTSVMQDGIHNTLYIPVDNLAQYVGLLAADKYNHPSERFTTIGVTGTNGKTSIANWLNQAYLLLQQKPAIIGTTGAGVYPNITDYAMTTPDPITLQKLLADFVSSNINYLVMEVSSHALHQGRVNGINFKTAIFTNLTPDHLDYHGTMEEYFKAKRELFYWHGLENAIINIDDPYGKRLYDELSVSKLGNNELTPNIISYGIDDKKCQICDLYAFDIVMDLSGMKFKINYHGKIQQFQVAVIGKFNIYNLLAVAAQLVIDGYDLEQIASVFAQIKSVCGRMDAIIQPNAPLVVVDYAHTPDALYNTLITLQQIPHLGKIYCVFGCGGDRDKTKRGLMGQIAVANSDHVIITTDNPRSEKPAAIIADIISGMPATHTATKLNDINNTNYTVIEDRSQAIECAIKNAKIGDIILIAGKGHETYQEINGVKHEFSDFKIANNILQQLVVVGEIKK
jgi:UDP-N-acetylmuramoyl-L-alanyl-D-glutamate--2,6-diaminopimelate ligase